MPEQLAGRSRTLCGDVLYVARFMRVLHCVRFRTEYNVLLTVAIELCIASVHTRLMMMITLEFAACAGIRDWCRPVSVLSYAYAYKSCLHINTYTYCTNDNNTMYIYNINTPNELASSYNICVYT